MHAHALTRALRAAAVCLSLALGVLAAGLVLSGVSVSPVLSDSMAPGFQRGDAVLIRLADTGSLQVGDIPVLTPPGQTAPVAHRIERVLSDSTGHAFQTRGDANSATDAWRSSVLTAQTPVVVGVLPHAGLVNQLFGPLPARPVLVALVGIILTALAVRVVTPSPAPLAPAAHPAP